MTRPTPTNPRRFWTPARLFRLAELTELGWGDAEIAETLSREWDRRITRATLSTNRYRHGLAGLRSAVLSARDVARMLGVLHPRTVIRWCRWGWLTAERGAPRGNARHWMIRPLDLWAFVEDPRFWCLWEPHLVTDERLRLHVAAVRGEPVWIPARDAVALLAARGIHVSEPTVHFWVRTGHLPSLRLPVTPGSRPDALDRRSLNLIPADALATVQPPPLGGAGVQAKRLRLALEGGGS